MNHADPAGARHTCALRTASSALDGQTDRAAGAGAASPLRSGGRLAAALAVSLLAAACAAGSTAEGASDEGGQAVGSVVLSVDGVSADPYVSGLVPASGRYFLAVEAALGDVSSRAPAPVAYSYFELVTRKGLALMPAPDPSMSVDAPCSPGTAVEPGTTYRCTLVFEIPEGDAPAELSYDDVLGDQATASVSYTRPASAACDTFAAYQSTATDACTECITTECAREGDAYASELIDGTTCPSAPSDCALTGTDTDCTSLLRCLGGCAPAYDALLKCGVYRCASACR
jgi:hypothetical protein